MTETDPCEEYVIGVIRNSLLDHFGPHYQYQSIPQSIPHGICFHFKNPAVGEMFHIFVARGKRVLALGIGADND